MKFITNFIIIAATLITIVNGAPFMGEVTEDTIVARAALAEAEAAAVAEAGPDAAPAGPNLAGMNKAQCRAACRGGSAAINQFCRAPLPLPVKAGCWAVAAAIKTPGGQTACTNWCDWIF